ncbi:tRNA-dihydrouridine(16/17) synthase [Cucumis melo var. makuwa]|uniref:tRNA-dihydrouridine(16/17) synthase n=1 Tax=Cucumis melo var. makuwa TaxID=1194695 RepID=A0A5A7VJ66_CUCMM|nr:tRNA-dihydrouridine(16/17) synthase [Cucumis melo var. makuwa]TYK00889.1 tRNA-dihydrouridine(16/17) synthase [Cucumis melo var. makuwa]
MASSFTQTLKPDLPPQDLDDLLCSHPQKQRQDESSSLTGSNSNDSKLLLGSPTGYLSGESRIERAWAHWTKLGRPKLIVAPMVDNSELPFRLLCRKYGADAAYTPMLHSRIFTENEKYRNMEFTTCQEDRPLFVQFCANDPDVLLEAARRVEPYCDYVDLNLGELDTEELPSIVKILEDVTLSQTKHCPYHLASWWGHGLIELNSTVSSLASHSAAMLVGGFFLYVFLSKVPEHLLSSRVISCRCPQRIARRGNYGAFLMDNLPLVKAIVEKLASNLQVPVSCKIRIFPNLQDTINYARMLEDAGCSLLAVHGRTRDEKDGKKFRANWSAISAVKNAVRIPVLANGNIRHMEDVNNCLQETGVEGVLSAETLLENPALFAGFRTAEWIEGQEENTRDGNLDQADLLVDYLKLCEKYPVPWRMIRSHVHKLLGDWFKIHPHIREDFNAQSKLTFEFLYNMVERLRELQVKMPLYIKDSHVPAISSNA